ncbi:MAG TPA: pteridine reductase, partial [Usitatibacteraceae bacterium]|nr:pteridine reductase [Usitatibacteraceae bacterium]
PTDLNAMPAADLPLNDKVVLVTGAARRIGAAIAQAFHAAGAKVAVHYHRSAAEAGRLVAAMNAERPGSAAAFGADLAVLAALEVLPAEVIGTLGALDVLVNNASTFYPTPVGKITPTQFEDLVGTNLRAPLFLSQAAAPELRRRKGLILNIADIHGLRPLGQHSVYCAAKAALVMLTQSLARELGPEIRVNAIAPGPVMWPENGVDEELRQRIVARTALKRGGSPNDIAKTAIFFATDAPFVTGQVLAVDGGRLIGGEDR